MAEIYQLPDSNSGNNAGMGNIPFSIPIGGFGGGLFGNGGYGMNGIYDLLGVAIIASLFGWNGGGFGGFGGGFGGAGDPDPNRWLINGIAKNTVASPTTTGRVVDIPIYHEAHFRAVELPDGSNRYVGERAWVCTGVVNLSNKTISS